MTEYEKYLKPETLAKISRLELRARMVVEGFISGMHKSPYQGFSVEFAAHREYVPGDDIRHIDWRLFARGDRLYIKQYEEETNLRTHLLLDRSASMLYPERPAGGAAPRLNKYAYAATLAASLAYLLIHQRDACGLTLFDNQVRERMAPMASGASLRSMIELMERHSPGNPTNAAAALSQLAEQARQRGLVVMISDLLTDVDGLIGGLQRLRHAGHDVIVMHVLDHDELEFPFQEQTFFEGLEEPGSRLLVDPQSLRSSYLAIVRRFISRMRSACMDHRIDYVLLSTAEPLDAGLAAFLASRMHRLARG